MIEEYNEDGIPIWCGTCEYHRNTRSKWKEDWYCDNEASDYYGCYTFYSDVCEDYEEKERR